ncbi:MAG TPA: bifunctional UDP-N-acetylglucosamine diphosphorylase/glucosamine-1-phosphate N-acetyltransferase GlmU [Firmicutes bacterium]|nr:bifunctional UDP-N-acetylglucosamine pyrophosphorylase / glucosamine-phosphate N-acetyltransferase [Bacillota bacterium]HHV57112.1 bifunctional UDP-N-acetylglucosamine diphosphorylase/glucosamine-1-phosphate N-acetyltransferase GlmU [Bacillota bacterium]
MSQLAAVILAAGKGTRMKSKRPKVLHEVCGRPLVAYVVEAARAAGAAEVVLVINHEMNAVRELFGPDVKYAYQKEQLGTGHAVLAARPALSAASGDVLVLCGDTPLLSGELLQALVTRHREGAAAATVLTAELKDPTGYGRVVRDAAGEVEAIVEERDAAPAVKALREVNTGSYCFAAAPLFAALDEVGRENAQGEYYLTDVLGILRRGGRRVLALAAPEPALTQGINNRVQLAEAEAFLRDRIRRELMLAGVTILDPASTFIDAGVSIAPDTVIYPFTIIEGRSSIGRGCRIGPSVQLRDSRVEDGATVSQAVLVEAVVGPGATVGPFTYLRPGTVLAEGAKAGTFVEIKKSAIGAGSKVPHLSYVGDAQVGRGVNIGAGTITCNYDGFKKNATVIEDEVFIGSNTNLVAPVRIGRGAYTGAGSTITRDVPPGALALERAEQRVLPDWVKKRLEKLACAKEKGKLE